MAKRPRLPAGHNTLDQILFDQGFGERRVCEGLILNGLVQVNGEVVDDLDAAFLEDRLNLVVDMARKFGVSKMWQCQGSASQSK